MSEPTDERSGVEILKEGSDGLRAPLLEEFASPTTHITDAGYQILKFHGSYQQDDRDLRLAGGHRDGLLDRHADEAAPLGPAAVVVADALIAEELVEDEPGMAAPLADPAVGDDVLVGGDALRLVQRGQLVAALERAVLADRLGPRDGRGARRTARRRPAPASRSACRPWSPTRSTSRRSSGRAGSRAARGERTRNARIARRSGSTR